MSHPPVVVTVGGSDSGGCYGVQADLRAFAAAGVHGACALTVVTAQNTGGMQRAVPIDPAMVEAQLDAVLEDLPVAAVKTGMLGRIEIVEVVGRYAAAGRLPNLVVDPVLVNRHGQAIFGDALADAYRRHLAPHARLLTPNQAEAALLLGSAGTDTAELAAGLARFGHPTVVTAGAGTGDQAVDVLWLDGEVIELAGPRVATTNAAGSGDAFSAWVTAGLARGHELTNAVRDAKARVHHALVGGAAWSLGRGPGPLDHFGWG